MPASHRSERVVLDSTGGNPPCLQLHADIRTQSTLSAVGCAQKASSCVLDGDVVRRTRQAVQISIPTEHCTRYCGTQAGQGNQAARPEPDIEHRRPETWRNLCLGPGQLPLGWSTDSTLTPPSARPRSPRLQGLHSTWRWRCPKPAAFGDVGSGLHLPDSWKQALVVLPIPDQVLAADAVDAQSSRARGGGGVASQPGRLSCGVVCLLHVPTIAPLLLTVCASTIYAGGRSLTLRRKMHTLAASLLSRRRRRQSTTLDHV